LKLLLQKTARSIVANWCKVCLWNDFSLSLGWFGKQERQLWLFFLHDFAWNPEKALLVFCDDLGWLQI
jgi:hypothetical protein